MSGDVKPSRRLKHKHKRLLTELEYLYSELDYYKEEHIFRKSEFQEEFLDFCEKYGYDCNSQKTIDTYQQKQVDPYRVKIEEDEQKEITDDLFDDEGEDEGSSKKDLKNLYKKIATKTHPDKLISEPEELIKSRKKKLFLDARSALEKQNFFKMSQIANELGIELPPPNDQQLMWMRTEKKKIEKTIDGIKQTFEWVYGEAEISVPRINLFYRYVEAIGCIKLEKEKDGAIRI